MLPAVSQLPDLPAPSSVSFVADLARFGDRLAIAHKGGELSYAELAARVHECAERLGTQRRLVLLAAANEIEPLVAYLAALHAGHPVLVAPGDHPARGRSSSRRPTTPTSSSPVTPTSGRSTLGGRRPRTNCIPTSRSC